MTTDTANAIAAAPTSRPRTNRLRAFSLVAPSTLIPTPLARHLAVGPGSRRRRRPLLDRRRHLRLTARKLSALAGALPFLVGHAEPPQEAGRHEQIHLSFLSKALASIGCFEILPVYLVGLGARD